MTAGAFPDIMLRGVVVPPRSGPQDVVIRGGTVAWIGEAGRVPAVPGVQLHDLSGHVLVPSFAEVHAHLDKALLTGTELAPGDLRSAIEAFKGGLYSRMGFCEVRDRALSALRIAIARGVTHIRTHVDCCLDDDLGALRALVQLRAELRDVVNIQVVALVTPPLGGFEASRQRLLRVLKEGPDGIGGCPSLEDDPASALDLILSVAMEAGAMVDLHVDESLDSGQNVLEMLAHAVIQRRFPHRVTASHCVSLGQRPDGARRDIIGRVVDAGIGVVTLPQTNLLLQGRSLRSGVPRGLAPVRDLLEAGAIVAAGSDNWRDPFNPLSRIDPLETVSLLVSAGHVTPWEALSMVANRARTLLGHPPVQVEVGAEASFVALRGASLAEALADASEQRLVIGRGRMLSRTTVSTELCPDLATPMGISPVPVRAIPASSTQPVCRQRPTPQHLADRPTQ